MFTHAPVIKKIALHRFIITPRRSGLDRVCCLYTAWVDDIKMIYSTISQKVLDGFGRNLVGQVGCVARTNRFDFGEDPNPDLDTRII